MWEACCDAPDRIGFPAKAPGVLPACLHPAGRGPLLPFDQQAGGPGDRGHDGPGGDPLPGRPGPSGGAGGDRHPGKGAGHPVGHPADPVPLRGQPVDDHRRTENDGPPTRDPAALGVFAPQGGGGPAPAARWRQAAHGDRRLRGCVRHVLRDDRRGVLLQGDGKICPVCETGDAGHRRGQPRAPVRSSATGHRHRGLPGDHGPDGGVSRSDLLGHHGRQRTCLPRGAGDGRPDRPAGGGREDPRTGGPGGAAHKGDPGGAVPPGRHRLHRNGLCHPFAQHPVPE